MHEAVPELVMLHPWRVPRRAGPAAMAWMATGRGCAQRLFARFAVEKVDGRDPPA